MQNFTITVTKDELDAYYNKYYRRDDTYKTGVTGYTDIVNDLGQCLGHGALEDAWYYWDNITEAQKIAHDQFNFEDALLALTDDALLKLCNDHMLGHMQAIDKAKDDTHTLIASYALHDADGFAELLEDVKNLDRDVLCDTFTEYQKAQDEAQEDAEKIMRREFISGDYNGNFAGIERDLEKRYGCESVDVQGYEAVTFTWDTREDAIVELDDRLGDDTDKETVHDFIIKDLCDDAKHYYRKTTEKNTKHKTEHEHLNAYKTNQKTKTDTKQQTKINTIHK